MIATGDYYRYALDLVKDIENHFNENRVQILIFTDIKVDLYFSKTHQLDHILINPEPWPEITLFRFDKVLQFKEIIQGQYLVWTDADMRLLRKFDPRKVLNNSPIKLSRHPGFSVNYAHVLKIIFRKPRLILTLIDRLLIISRHKQSAEGWEVKEESAAFVPLSKREIYVQGGFWIAKKKQALEMCESIQRQILRDLEIGHVPVYHDETYLNWYMSLYYPKVLPKDFVGVEGYLWQSVEKSYLICVDKSKNQTE